MINYSHSTALALNTIGLVLWRGDSLIHLTHEKECGDVSLCKWRECAYNTCLCYFLVSRNANHIQCQGFSPIPNLTWAYVVLQTNANFLGEKIFSFLAATSKMVRLSLAIAFGQKHLLQRSKDTPNIFT